MGKGISLAEIKDQWRGAGMKVVGVTGERGASVLFVILGLGGNWGSSCRGCLFFSFVNSGPRGQLGLQLSGCTIESRQWFEDRDAIA